MNYRKLEHSRGRKRGADCDCDRFASANNLADELYAVGREAHDDLSGQAITVVSEGLTSTSPALAIAISSARTPSAAGAQGVSSNGTSPVPFLVEVNLRHGVPSTD